MSRRRPVKGNSKSDRHDDHYDIDKRRIRTLKERSRSPSPESPTVSRRKENNDRLDKTKPKARPKNHKGRTLIVMAATKPNDPLYGEYFKEISMFQINLAETFRERGESVMIFCDPTVAGFYLQYLPAECVLQQELLDIHVGHYCPAIYDKQIWFQYRPYAHGTTSISEPKVGKAIQDRLNIVLRKYCGPNNSMMPQRSNLILNGGNLVDNDYDKVIVSDRMFADNRTLSSLEGYLENKMKKVVGCDNVAVCPDTGRVGDYMEHHVAFLSRDTIILDESLPRDLYSATEQALNVAFGGDDAVDIRGIDCRPNYELWNGHTNTAGLYTCVLMTENNLYVPVFGGDEKNREISEELDDEVLDVIMDMTDLPVVAVEMDSIICRLGLSLRSITWCLYGPLADQLVDSARAFYSK